MIERILRSLGIIAMLEAEVANGEFDYGEVLRRVHSWRTKGPGGTAVDESETTREGDDREPPTSGQTEEDTKEMDSASGAEDGTLPPVGTDGRAAEGMGASEGVTLRSLPGPIRRVTFSHEQSTRLLELPDEEVQAKRAFHKENKKTQKHNREAVQRWKRLMADEITPTEYGIHTSSHEGDASPEHAPPEVTPQSTVGVLDKRRVKRW
jgi:hypothetical protein